MSFDDFAARMKAKQQQKQGAQPDSAASYDFSESYRIRAKMLGVLLCDARESAVRTQEDCARLLNIGVAEYQAWELGDSAPTLPQLELLAYYLDVPVSHFWGMETTKISRAGRQHAQPEYLSLRNRMIGALLQKARQEADLSHDDIAESCGIPAQTIMRYELGEAAPPMHELSVLASAVNRNLSYFLETSGQIGELLAMREAWKHFADLPEDVRAFAADPKNIGFIHIAVLLSQMPTDRLREVGASILDITM
ncbi:MAG: transcriptional regulator [Anaerolineaceae bacterium]|nr:MAG: transcriptional regulator [Anaerolineaceae bacterium]